MTDSDEAVVGDRTSSAAIGESTSTNGANVAISAAVSVPRVGASNGSPFSQP